MKERITVRVGRIIGGSLNALIDAVEGAAPAVVQEEAIREVDGAIDEVRSEIGQALTRQQNANARLIEANDRHEGLTEKITIALKEDREDLAEVAQGRQIEIEDQIPVLERAIAEAGEEHKELEGYLAALQAKKREMQDELKKFTKARERTAGGAGDPQAGRTSKVKIGVEKRTSAFDRISIVRIVVAAALAVSGCQTMTRTEIVSGPSFYDGYQGTKVLVHLFTTQMWGATVYIKRAESDGKLELCGFAVLAGNKHTQPNWLINQATPVLKSLLIEIGSKEVSHTGFIEAFSEYKNVKAPCILTDTPFENTLLTQMLYVGQKDLYKGVPLW